MISFKEFKKKFDSLRKWKKHYYHYIKHSTYILINDSFIVTLNTDKKTNNYFGECEINSQVDSYLTPRFNLQYNTNGCIFEKPKYLYLGS